MILFVCISKRHLMVYESKGGGGGRPPHFLLSMTILCIRDLTDMKKVFLSNRIKEKTVLISRS